MRIEINQSGRTLVGMIWHPNQVSIEPRYNDHFLFRLRWIGPKWAWTVYVRAGGEKLVNYRRFGWSRRAIKEKNDDKKPAAQG